MINLIPISLAMFAIVGAVMFVGHCVGRWVRGVAASQGYHRRGSSAWFRMQAEPVVAIAAVALSVSTVYALGRVSDPERVADGLMAAALLLPFVVCACGGVLSKHNKA